MIPAILALACASAQAYDLEPPYSWDPVVDSSITVSTGATWLLLYTAVHSSVPTDPGSGELMAIDRIVPSDWSPAVPAASDYLLYGSIAGALVASGLAGRRAGDVLTPAAMVVQSFSVNGFVTDLVKTAVDRPRPYTTLDDPPQDVIDSLGTAEAYRSFPSGHTSFEAALSFSTASVFVHHGARPLPAYLGAGLLTATMGGLRVAGGRHYPSDVIAGGLLGAAVGLSVPELHRQQQPLARARAEPLRLSPWLATPDLPSTRGATCQMPSSTTLSAHRAAAAGPTEASTRSDL